MVENAAHRAPPATPRPDRPRPRCLGLGRLHAAARGRAARARSRRPRHRHPQAAGGRLSDLAGLVCLSYPLHRPGAPDDGLRTEHWPRIAVPTLILEGEADPFARIDLLRAAMPLLPRGHLVTFPRLAHGLLPVLDEALDALVEWLGGAIVDRSVH